MYINFFSPYELVTGSVYLLGQRIDEAIRSKRATHAAYPTICVGNFQAGGTGKTPATLWVAKQLKALGFTPIILIRGYKGAVSKSIIVDTPDARKYGDETILQRSTFLLSWARTASRVLNLPRTFPARTKYW